MICKECSKAGLKSCVYSHGGSRTLMYSAPFWDENGCYHDHDPNIGTYGYECSNGHTWTESSRSSCWCGWPNKEVVDETDND